MMSGGRHKKEIKRRTKTGCLTCRKRRIKVSIPLGVCYFHPVGFRDGCQCSMEEVEAFEENCGLSSVTEPPPEARAKPTLHLNFDCICCLSIYNSLTSFFHV